MGCRGFAVSGRGRFGRLGDMKRILFLLMLLCLMVAGCVNQSIAARRSDIPWNRTPRSEATGALPTSLTDQYD